MATITGTSGNDTITPGFVSGGVTGGVPGSGDDSILGLAGNDSLDGGGGNDTLNGGDNNDTLQGGIGNDSLDGGVANDVLIGGFGNDTFVGGGGNDFLSYSWVPFASTVVVSVASISGPNIGNTVVKSDGAGTDSFRDIRFFVGSAGNDRLEFTGTSASSAILFQGGLGADTINGNGFFNLYADYSDNTTGVTADLDMGTASADGSPDLLVNVRALRGGSGNDVFSGDEFDNRFAARGGTNTVDGRGGFDSVLADGLGAVTATFSGVGAGTMSIALSGGGTATTSFTNIERIVASGLADNLTGSSGDDWLAPGEGADVINGGAGYDYVDYGWFFVSQFSGVTVNLAAQTATDWSGATDSLSGIEAAYGTGFGDDLTGATAAQTGGSRSMLRGAGGNDTIRGSGTDAIATADYRGTGSAAITADLRNAADMFVLDGGGGRDVLIGIRSIRGSSFDDTMYGGSAAERLDGGAGGDDSLLGGGGNDTLEPGNGNNVVDGGDGFDTMVSGDIGTVTVSFTAPGAGTMTVNLTAGGTATTAFSNIEYIVGSGGTDTYAGGAGDDYFAPLGGNDVGLDGGGGYDWLTYRYEPTLPSTGAVVNLAAGTASDGRGGNDTFVNFEAVSGTSLADDLTGAVLAGAGARLRGNEGADTIRGVAGDATIIADYRNGTTPGEQGIVANLTDAANLTVVDTYGDTDRLFNIRNVSGSDFGDSMAGGTAGEVFSGLLGDDTLSGGGGADTLTGGGGSDSLTGGSGADSFVVAALSDIGPADVITDFGGADRLDLSALAGTFVGSAPFLANGTSQIAYRNTGGTTQVQFDADGDGVSDAQVTLNGTLALGETSAGSRVLQIVASAGPTSGDDNLTGTAGDDTIDGLGGNDTIAGLGGADSLTGSNGSDSLLGGDGADTLKGVTGTDRLEGGADGDSLEGGDGNDTLDGGTGADTLVGGIGNDVLLVDNVSDVVTEAPGEGTDEVRTSVTLTASLAANVENLALLGTGNLRAIGNDLANVMTGNAGDNRLDGGLGNDTLDGGAGADRLTGGAGADTILVDNAGDVVIELSTDADIDVVNASVSYALAGAAAVERLFLTGSALDATGNDFAQRIVGNALGNALSGGGGADTLDGGAGADTLTGGQNSDTYFVDDAGDVVSEVGATGNDDTVNATISYALTDGVEHLNLQGTAVAGTGNGLNNQIGGNALANLLSGLDGNDVLAGGDGADTLIGGIGADKLNGEAGADTIRYGAATEGGDKIAGFVHGTDRIEVSAAGFGGGLAEGAALGTRFVANTSGRADAATGQFVFETDAGKLWWDADGTGAAARVLIATFTGTAPSLDASDLVVIA